MSKGAWLVGGLTPAAVESYAALTVALARLADEGHLTPCQGPERHLWTSEVHEDLEAAGYRCTACPLLDTCGRHADHERANTWGGTDRTKTTRRSA